ncbi:hypothetical protein DV735_g912, partial [Chaetothyriales sp. CBS 134920]
MSDRAFISLTPANALARLAFSDAYDSLMTRCQNSQADGVQAAFRRMRVKPEQIYDKEIIRLRYTDTESMLKETGKIWSGCYVLELHNLPSMPERGWIAGKGPLVNTFFRGNMGFYVMGCSRSHLAQVSVNGNSVTQPYHLNQHTMNIIFDKLEYRFEWMEFATKDQFKQERRYYVDSAFGGAVSTNVDVEMPTPLPSKRTIAGTIGYLAPEFELENYDHSIDIWSMAIILFELTYNCHPWKFSINPWRNGDDNEKLRPTFLKSYQSAIDTMGMDSKSAHASPAKGYVHLGDLFIEMRVHQLYTVKIRSLTPKILLLPKAPTSFPRQVHQYGDEASMRTLQLYLKHEWRMGHTPPEIKERRKAELKAYDELEGVTSEDDSDNEDKDRVKVNPDDKFPTPPRSADGALVTPHRRKRRKLREGTEEEHMPTKKNISTIQEVSIGAEDTLSNTARPSSRKRQRTLDKGDEEHGYKQRPSKVRATMARSRERLLKVTPIDPVDGKLDTQMISKVLHYASGWLHITCDAMH